MAADLGCVQVDDNAAAVKAAHYIVSWSQASSDACRPERNYLLFFKTVKKMASSGF
jgi:hypothetical protein